MIRAPELAPYPMARVPIYSRWLTSGLVLLVIWAGLSVVFRPFIESRLAMTSLACVFLVWLLALLLRVLYFRLNRHTAQHYHEAAEQVRLAWWQHHRQKVGLVESVLVSPTCTKPEHGLRLFNSDYPPPMPQKTPEGRTLYLRQVFGSDVAGRERNMAILLAQQWNEQREEHSFVQPLRCYWLGSQAAWQAFVQQVALSTGRVQLPEQPETWEGIRSLDSVIDQLQGAATTARILCAGCQSSPVESEGQSPSGEAALLWLFGPEGGVRFTRGEWFSADTEPLSRVAERALQQSDLTTPAELCVSFAQPNIAELSAIDWKTKPQDANFGTLDRLQAMVAQTLAAWYAQEHQVPCAWLANDPHHTLAVGVVKPDD
ncbi:hypothetical protein HX832_30920 [Pseudomonas sp. IPO3749]|nr:hypothetical protein [Pseudomonas sp. IPO3749]NWF24498.1 hypothetical protein [Pseudomonas sp. IPO3749]